MGIPIKPITPGNDCGLCYPAGKTPDRVLVSIAGMETGEYWHDGLAPPPNGTWTLYQNQYTPCYFNNSIDNPFIMAWHFENIDTHFSGFYQFPPQGFFGQEYNNCIRHLTNAIQGWSATFYHGGYFFLSTSTEIVALVETVMPVEASDAKFEIAPGPDKIIVIRYASKKQRTNIELKFDLS